MKLTERHTKTVDYFGIEVEVPKWVKWVATNPNGRVVGFFQEPWPEYWDIWFTRYDDEDTLSLMEVDLEGVDWKETLLYVGD